ncbi:hypothetical protein CMV_025349 [Castanea mollissima]|uniref:Small ribosomal subunit protein uS5 C-terminal domain-containing protein n=1 Tax=Castanea mollissima TaxID=60419 RepID=A0A8J4QCR5_9ROSI|nr:hypothetical protein CMV_025349 [Castanea mollissima]
MVPAPRGAGIVAARVPKKVLRFAGIDDVFTSSRGSTKTLGNFIKGLEHVHLQTLTKGDIVFLAPPWGGPSYKGEFSRTNGWI